MSPGTGGGEGGDPALPVSSFATGTDLTGAVAGSVNLFTGDVALPLTLVTVPGRGGLTASVGALYSSGTEESLSTWNLEAPTGAMGLGWSLGFDRIVANHKGTGARLDDEFYYVAGGASQRLLEQTAPTGATYQLFRTEAQPAWEFRYAAGTETWTVYRDDGVAMEFGNQDSGRSTVTWMVRWGSFLGPAYDATGQSRYATGWNLSRVTNLFGESATYEYEVEEGRLGPGSGSGVGLAFTQAAYLKRVTGPDGQSAELVYEQKCNGSGSGDCQGTGTRAEYLDPHIEANEPDAYQEQYETRFLRRVDAKAATGSVLFSVDLTYDFVVGGGLTAATGAKRRLVSVTHRASNGETLPPLTFVYTSTVAANPSALLTVTSPSGSVATYTYSTVLLGTTSSGPLELTVNRPSGYDGVPRVWNGPDYVVIGWHKIVSGNNNDLVRIEAYRWTGRWVGGFVNTITAEQSTASVPTQNYEVVPGHDHFTVAINTITPYVLSNKNYIFGISYYSDPSDPSKWIGSSSVQLEVDSAQDYSITDGDRYVAFSSIKKGLLKVITWSGAAWSQTFSTTPVPGGTSLKVTGQGNWLIAHQSGSQGVVDAAYLFVLNGRNIWSEGISFLPAGFDVRDGGIKWTAGDSYAIATGDFNSIDPGTGYLTNDEIIFSWNENYSVSSRLISGFGSISGINSVASENIAVIKSSSSFVASYRNGSQWSVGSNTATSASATVGPGYAVSSSTFSSPARIHEFNPNTLSFTLLNPDPSYSNAAYFNPGFGYFTFRRGQSSSSDPIYAAIRSRAGTWPRTDLYPGFIPYIISTSPSFAVAQDRPSGSDLGKTSVYYVRNGSILTIPTSYGTSNVQTTIAQPLYPVGPTSYITYCEQGCPGGTIASAGAVTLHFVSAGRSHGIVQDHPVTSLALSDGYQSTNAAYSYTASTVALDRSGTSVQYNEVTTYTGTTTSSQPRYGSTKTYFFNGVPLADLGAPAQPLVVGSSNVASYVSRLAGTPYSTVVFDKDGTQVATEQSSITVDRPIMEGGLGFLAHVTATRSVRDGVTIDAYRDYNPDNGYLVSETTNHWREGPGQGTPEKSTTTYYRYFKEGYPSGGPINLASPVIEVSERIAGTTIRAAATTWKNWGNGHWAPFETYVLTGLAAAPPGPQAPLGPQSGPPIDDCPDGCPPPPPRTTYSITYTGLPYFSWFTGGTPTTPTWLRTARVVSRVGWGGARESEGVDGVRASVQYDGAGYPTAAFSNASVSEDQIGADASWLDFESGDETSWIAANDYWGFYSQNGFSTDAHSGHFSRSIGGTDVYGPTRAFQPTDQNGRYVFSAWVKTAPGFAGGQGHFVFNTRVLGGAEGSPGVSAGLQGIDFGDTNGQWVYIERVIDLALVRSQSGISPSTTLQLLCYIYQRDASHELLVDDLRLSPLVGGFTATTYDPVTRLATAAHGVNGSASFTSYDAFGRGVEARDRRGRVMAESFGALSREKTGGAFSPANPNEAVQRSYPTANLVANGTLELGAVAGGGPAGWAVAYNATLSLARGYTGRYGLQVAAGSTGSEGYIHTTLYDRGALKPNTTYRYSVMAKCLIGGTCAAEVFLMRLGTDGSYVVYANAVFTVTSASWQRYTGTITTNGDSQWGNGNLIPTLRLDVNASSKTIIFDDVVLNEGVADTPPTYAVSYSDGGGKLRQSQTVDADSVLVSEALYDLLGRAVAQTMPARAGTLFGYRSGFVADPNGDGRFGELNPEGTSNYGSLGSMSGEVASKNTLALGYPYAQTRFERSPLGRPLESGQVGSTYRIGAGLTVLYTYGNATPATFPGIGTAGKYFMTTVSTPDEVAPNRVTVRTVTDMLGRTYATQGAPITLASGTTQSPVTWYDYNDRGDLFRTRLPRYGENAAFKTESTYDFAGRPLTSSSPDAGTARTIYDTSGRPRFTQHADAISGNYVLYTRYDRVGRPIESGYVSQTWDAAFLQGKADDPAWPAAPATWRLKSVYDQSGTTLTQNQGRLMRTESNRDATAAAEATESYTYDERGRTVSVALTVAAFNATPRVVGYTYNDRGDVRTVVYGATPTTTNQVAYAYDGLGRVVAVGTSTNWTGYRTYEYRQDGQIKRYYTGDEDQTNLSYDDRGRLTKIQAPGFSEALTYTPRRGLVNTAAYTYSGNTTLAALTHSYIYTYDAAGQLTSADNLVNSALDIGITGARVTQYDLHGNITRLQRGTGAATTYTYTAGTNRLYSAAGVYYYDGRGNMASTSGRTIQYDPFLNLSSSYTNTSNYATTAYTYLGRRRVLKDTQGTRTLYVHGASDSPLWTEGAGGTVSYVYGPDGLVATIKGVFTRYVIADHLGSTRVLLNFDSDVEEAYTYGAYGETADVYQGGTAYRYTGQELDAESGLLNYRARLYDPVLGRFLAMDPQGQFASPYVYVGNNPVMGVDPDGEFAFVPILIGIGIGAAIGGSGSAAIAAVTGQNVGKAFLMGAVAGGITGGISALGAQIGSAALTTALNIGGNTLGQAASGAVSGQQFGWGDLAGSIAGGAIGSVLPGISAVGGNEWTPKAFTWIGNASNELAHSFFKGMITGGVSSGASALVTGSDVVSGLVSGASRGAKLYSAFTALNISIHGPIYQLDDEAAQVARDAVTEMRRRGFKGNFNGTFRRGGLRDVCTGLSLCGRAQTLGNGIYMGVFKADPANNYTAADARSFYLNTIAHEVYHVHQQVTQGLGLSFARVVGALILYGDSFQNNYLRQGTYENEAQVFGNLIHPYP